MLCGCKSNDTSKAKTIIANTFESKVDTTNVLQNNYSKYYSFYLPSDMIIKEKDETYLIANYLENNILININVAKIVNSMYWKESYDNKDGFFDTNKLYFAKEGYFANYSGDVNLYSLNIYLYNDIYLIDLESDDLKLFSFVEAYDLVDVAQRMYYLINVFTINEEMVVDNFTDKNVIDYNRKQIDLFEYIVPSSGAIEDLLK